MGKIAKKITHVFIIFVFGMVQILPVYPAKAQAQTLPAALIQTGVNASLTTSYRPALIQGITLNTTNPFAFDFIIHPGDDNLQGDAFKKESMKMIKYFLAALTVPEEDMWVNLSPYEKNRIIPDGFGQTEMGRDLLAQDYMLKQLTASLMSPEDALGAAFWERIKEEAYRKHGIRDVPTEIFNKVWIVPERASVYENKNSVFVVGSYLKVMLESDYLASQESGQWSVISDQSKNTTTEHGTQTTQVVREIIIPAIEREVNEGKTFANLRQITNAVILASWYKTNIKQSLLTSGYVNRNITQGVDVADKDVINKIYNQYVAAFKEGVYDLIKEEYDPIKQQIIPRKYFSGGMDYASLDGNIKREDNAAITVAQNITDAAAVSVTVGELKTDKAALTARDVFLHEVKDFKQHKDAYLKELNRLLKAKNIEDLDEMEELLAFNIFLKMHAYYKLPNFDQYSRMDNENFISGLKFLLTHYDRDKYQNQTVADHKRAQEVVARFNDELSAHDLTHLTELLRNINSENLDQYDENEKEGIRDFYKKYNNFHTRHKNLTDLLRKVSVFKDSTLSLFVLDQIRLSLNQAEEMAKNFLKVLTRYPNLRNTLAFDQGIKIITKQIQRLTEKIESKDIQGSISIELDIKRIFNDLRDIFGVNINVVLENVQKNRLNVPLDRIYNILYLLVENANRARVAGRAFKMNAKISLINQESEKFLEIKVSDNGKGMSEQTLRKVGREQFTTKKGVGHGIGVFSMRKEIENEYGGSVTIQSTEGVGSTFILTFPIEYDENEESEQRNIKRRESNNSVISDAIKNEMFLIEDDVSENEKQTPKKLRLVIAKGSKDVSITTKIDQNVAPSKIVVDVFVAPDKTIYLVDALLESQQIITDIIDDYNNSVDRASLMESIALKQHLDGVVETLMDKHGFTKRDLDEEGFYAGGTAMSLKDHLESILDSQRLDDFFILEGPKSVDGDIARKQVFMRFGEYIIADDTLRDLDPMFADIPEDNILYLPGVQDMFKKAGTGDMESQQRLFNESLLSLVQMAQHIDEIKGETVLILGGLFDVKAMFARLLGAKEVHTIVPDNESYFSFLDILDNVPQKINEGINLFAQSQGEKNILNELKKKNIRTVVMEVGPHYKTADFKMLDMIKQLQRSSAHRSSINLFYSGFTYELTAEKNQVFLKDKRSHRVEQEYLDKHFDTKIRGATYYRTQTNPQQIGLMYGYRVKLNHAFDYDEYADWIFDLREKSIQVFVGNHLGGDTTPAIIFEEIYDSVGRLMQDKTSPFPDDHRRLVKEIVEKMRPQYSSAELEVEHQGGQILIKNRDEPATFEENTRDSYTLGQLIRRVAYAVWLDVKSDKEAANLYEQIRLVEEAYSRQDIETMESIYNPEIGRGFDFEKYHEYITKMETHEWFAAAFAEVRLLEERLIPYDQEVKDIVLSKEFKPEDQEKYLPQKDREISYEGYEPTEAAQIIYFAVGQDAQKAYGVLLLMHDRALSLAQALEIIDRAALSDEAKEADAADLGGIDLNPQNFDIENTSGSRFTFDFEFNEQDIINIRQNGLTPVIINITPITNIPLLLGLNREQEEKLSYLLN